MHKLLIAGLAAIIAGCQTTSNDAPDTGNAFTPEPETILQETTLTKELLAQLLTAEIAVRKNRYGEAVEQLLLSAQESRHPAIAAKAAYWSMQSGQFQKAKTAARLWLDLLKSRPANELSNPRIVLAISLMELNEHDEALPVLVKAIEDSDDPDIYKRIASEMSRLRNPSGVTGFYQKLIVNAADQENANLGMAILSARLHDFELSKKSIDKVLQVNPGNEDAALIKISYMFEAETEEDVVRFAEKFLRKNRNAHDFRMEYARYLSSNKHHEKAISQFAKVAARDEQQAQEARLNIISLAMQEENFKLADANLLTLLDTDPTNSRLIYFRCQVQRELGNYPAARDLCNEISLGEFYFPAQMEIANVMADNGELEAALTHLDSVPVAGSDEQIQIYLRKQQLMYQYEQLERSVAILTSGLNKYPENTSLLYARGLVLSELGRVKEHERDMRKLIQLDPDNAHAYNALGYTLTDLTTRYDEALELIQKAVELNPDDAYILDSLGWVYFKLNDLEQARVHLEQAFDLSGDAEIAAHLGELYWTLGDKSKAKSIWRKAIKDTPDNKVLNKTLERFL